MKSGPPPLRLVLLAAAAVAALAAAPGARAATNLLNVYIGGSYGHADVRARDGSLIAGVPGSRVGGFAISDSAYQIAAGVRGLELLGAEVDYFDLGSGRASPSWSGPGSLTSARVSQKGEAAFAVLYLPIPIIDVYIKAGVARLTTQLSASASGSNCVPNQPCTQDCIVGGPCGGPFTVKGTLETTETAFAGGAGVQWKLGDWAIRGEYERFSALGGHPSLVSVGVTWSLL